jgi:hypothetical protein
MKLFNLKLENLQGIKSAEYSWTGIAPESTDNGRKNDHLQRPVTCSFLTEPARSEEFHPEDERDPRRPSLPRPRGRATSTSTGAA